MQRIATFFLLAGVMGASAGDRFYLKSEQTGRFYGPYEAVDGQEIVFGKVKFTVVTEKKEAADTQASVPPEILEPAVAAAETWLQLVDAGETSNAWNGVSAYMKATIDQGQFQKALAAIDSALGKVARRELGSTQLLSSMPSAPDGQYVVLRYEAERERKKSAIETVIPMLDVDGKWRVSGYDVR